MFLLLWCIAYLIYIYILHLFKVFKHAVVVSANCLCSQTSYWYSLWVQTISSNYSSARNCNSSYTVPSKDKKLVGGLELFFSIGNFIIPTDELIFFRGVGSTTNQKMWFLFFFSVEGLQRHFSLVFPGWSVPRPPVTALSGSALSLSRRRPRGLNGNASEALQRGNLGDFMVHPTRLPSGYD